jgi:hypothetical protein
VQSPKISWADTQSTSTNTNQKKPVEAKDNEKDIRDFQR